MNWMVTATTESVKAVFARIGNFLPTLVGALLILLVGWIIAGWLQRFLVGALKTVGVDELARRFQIDEFLQKGDIKHSLSDLIGIFLYWLVILAAFLAALNALSLTVAAELLERLIGYMPSVLAGIVVLILGLFFSTMIGGIVQTAAANAGITQAKGLGQIARVTNVVFSVVVALEKFFSSMIIQTTFTVVIAAVAFGLALSFALGSKDIVARYLADFIDKVKRR